MLGGRIRQARLLAGLTQEKFAALLAENGYSVTKQAISKYENEGSTPPAQFLLLSAELLSIPNSYFVYQSKSKVDWLAFRRHSAFPIHDQEMVKTYASDIAELQIELQNLLHPSIAVDLPPAIRVNSYEDAENAALQLRDQWGLDQHPIENLVQMVEAHQVIVVGWSKGEGKFDGLSGWCDQYPVTVINTQVQPDRRRFTLSHELGHLVMDTRHLDEDVAEKFANRFAANLLVPTERAIHELGKRRTRLDWDELGILKRKYGLSMAGWVKRAVDLEIITPNHATQLHIQLRQNHWHTREPVEYIADESPVLLDQMAHHATAEGLIGADRIQSVYPAWKEGEMPTPDSHHTTVYDLLAMSEVDRQQFMDRAFALAAQDTFETFDAFDDMDFNDAAFSA